MTPSSAFTGFLNTLREEGFAAGVDRLVLVERLLQGPGRGASPQRLKRLLCPLFASTAEQQEQFGKLFDDYFHLSGFEGWRSSKAAEAAPVVEKAAEPETDSGRDWLPVIASLVLALLVATVAIPRLTRGYEAEPLRPKPFHIPTPCPIPCNPYRAPIALLSAGWSSVGERAVLNGADSRSSLGLPLQYRWILVERPEGSRARLMNATAAEAYLLPDRPGTYMVQLLVEDGLGRSEPRVTNLNVSEKGSLPDRPPAFSLPKERWKREAVVWAVDLRWLYLPCAGVGGMLVFFGWKYARRRLVLDRIRKEDLGRSHQMRNLELPGEHLLESSVRGAIRAMRRPFLGSSRLHVTKTIAATVRHAGFPKLVLEPARSRPRYLLLVDTLAKRDHQSELFQEVVRLLNRSGLSLSAYLYAGDPRVCWPMPGVTRGPASVALTDLITKASGARLVLLGDGAELVSEDGELWPWAQMFHQWSERAIFTPKLPSQWTAREQVLAKWFMLLPAKPASFQKFLDQRKETSDFGASAPLWEYAAAKDLQARLSPDVYRWLCACALYPRLEWPLTQTLGKELKLYSEDNLLELVRLPWFRRGELPLQLQQELVDSMPDDEREAARAVMVHSLEGARNSGAEVSGFEIAVLREALSPVERRMLRRHMAAAREPEKQDRPWLIEAPGRLARLLMDRSEWIGTWRRRMIASACGVVVLAALAALGTQGVAEIRQAHLGPEGQGLPALWLDEPVVLARISSNGRIAGIGSSGKILIWKLSGDLEAQLRYSGVPKEAAFSSGSTVLTVSGTGGVCAMKVAEGSGCVGGRQPGELVPGGGADSSYAVIREGVTYLREPLTGRRIELSDQEAVRVYWAAADRGWMLLPDSVRPFEVQGGQVRVGASLASGLFLVGLDRVGNPVLTDAEGRVLRGTGGKTEVLFVWKDRQMAGRAVNSVVVQDAIANRGGNSIVLTPFRPVGSKERQLGFSSRVMSVAYSSLLGRLVAGLQSGRVDVVELAADDTPELQEIVNQRALAEVRIPQALLSAPQLAPVDVALIDTGVNLPPNFSGRILIEPSPAGATEGTEHGTHNASIVLAVAPNARILPVPNVVSDRSPDAGILRGIAYAAQQNADIILINLGRESGVEEQLGAYQAAVRSASRSLVIVASHLRAGQDRTGDVGVPAKVPGVMAIAPSNARGTLAAFAVVGPETALAAPGENVRALTPRGGLSAMSGSSMSASIVAGVAALVKGARPELTPAQIRQVLVSTATPIAGQQFGIVNAAAALARVAGNASLAGLAAEASARVSEPATPAGDGNAIVLRGHAGPVSYASFSPQGDRVVTASVDGTARIWSVEKGTSSVTFTGHTGRVQQAKFSPDGARVVTAGVDGTARVWDPTTGKQVLQIRTGNREAWSADYSPDGRLLLTAGSESVAQLWDAAGGKLIAKLEGGYYASFSRDGQRVLTVGDLSTGVSIWTTKGERVVKLPVAVDAAFAPNGQAVVTAGADRTARVWALPSGSELMLLSGHSSEVRFAIFANNAPLIATAGWDNLVKLWDASSGALRHTLNDSGMAGVAFSPDGRSIATAGLDSIARIWSTTDGRLLTTLSGHAQRVTHLEFSRDGRRIVTANGDGTARIWNAPSSPVQTAK